MPYLTPKSDTASFTVTASKELIERFDGMQRDAKMRRHEFLDAVLRAGLDTIQGEVYGEGDDVAAEARAESV